MSDNVRRSKRQAEPGGRLGAHEFRTLLNVLFNLNMITIELYGIPRLRAETDRVSVDAATVGEALGKLVRACPRLMGAIVDGGRVLPAYKLSINGDRFVSDPDTPLSEGDALLLLSADVGG